MELLTVQDGDAAFRKLMASPVSAPRKRIRKSKVDVGDSIDSAGKSLADLWRTSYRGKHAGKSPLFKPVPSYAQWLRSFMSGADAASELERAKAEWAAIHEHAAIRALRSRFGLQTRPHQGAREMARRRSSVTIAHTVTRLCDCVRSNKTPSPSRASWPSFRPAQLDAIYATEGVSGLISVNATPAEINSRAGQFARAA